MEEIGIAIEFFEPTDDKKKFEGRLYMIESGKSFFEFEGSLVDAFRTFPVIYAISTEDEKYTFINCMHKQSKAGICRFFIRELYKGDHISNVTEKDCREIEGRITGLTNWINHPRIKPFITFSVDDNSKVIMKEMFKRQFDIRADVILELCEFCGEQYSRNETILQNLSYFKIYSDQSNSRFELYKDATALSKFLSLFTFKVPKFTDLNFTYSTKRTVELLTVKQKSHPDDNEALLKFDKLEPYLPETFRVLYESRDKFISVLKLFIEGITNHTPEISFLNITTAFEVFHKNFLEASSTSRLPELYRELNNAGLVNRNTEKWDQILRYLHLFKLTEKFDFQIQDFPDPLNTLDIMRESRNYYTHYTPTRKKVWTPNELIYANRTLAQVLKAALLQELRIPIDLNNQLLNHTAAYIYQDFESNKFSLFYVEK